MRERTTGKTKKVYAHECGDGWAHVPDEVFNPLSKLVTMFDPKRVLVLFAGVGADMVEIDALCGNRCKITGVEINRHMVEHALAEEPGELKEFLGQSRISLEVAEAREYLERDESRYDAILLSWWGAAISQYVGTAGFLAQYLYTEEAYSTLIDHLTPEGTIIIFNGSKAETMVGIRHVFEEKGLGSLADRAVILKIRGEDDSFAGKQGFFDVLENMRLIIKPSGFSGAQMDIVRRTADELEADIIFSPERVDANYSIYGDIARGRDLNSINDELIASSGVELSLFNDDRPFTNKLMPRSYYFDIDRWLHVGDHGQWLLTRILLAFVLLLSSAAVVLIVGPLLNRSGPALSAPNIVELFYFLSLGSGFILIEVGLVRKLGLLLGHPSYAISIVLASLIFSTGVGSLCSDRLFRTGILRIKRTAALIVVYVLLGTALYEVSTAVVIALPFLVKSILVILFLFPMGFLMGQLFPQGLVRVGREDPRLVPWAWAINATSSTIFVGAGYLLSYPLGFRALLLLGATFYFIIILLPLRSSPQT